MDKQQGATRSPDDGRLVCAKTGLYGISPLSPVRELQWQWHCSSQPKAGLDILLMLRMLRLILILIDYFEIDIDQNIFVMRTMWWWRWWSKQMMIMMLMLIMKTEQLAEGNIGGDRSWWHQWCRCHHCRQWCRRPPPSVATDWLVVDRACASQIHWHV